MERSDLFRSLLRRTANDEGYQTRMRELEKLDGEYGQVLQGLSEAQYRVYLKYHNARDNLMMEMAAVAYEMGLEDGR